MPNKLTLEDMKNLAKARNGKCLSKRYINFKLKLKWQCNKGHIWEAKPTSIKNRAWCPQCSGNVKKSINDMSRYAKNFGGKCLSKKYINNTEKLKWQCKKGHVWEELPRRVKYVNCCPFCRGVRFTIKDMEKLAKERKGRCLSKKYINMQSKLKWQCNKGHTWFAIPGAIKHSRTWCPHCVGRYITIKDMKILAEKRNGICLSKKYINNETKLKWKCDKGHTWMARPSSIKNGSWCPNCRKRISTIKDMQNLAALRKGKCLSKKYTNYATKLKWKCNKGHTWFATPANIKSSKWCPQCAGTAKKTIEEMHQLAKKMGGWCLSKEYINTKTHLKWKCYKNHIWFATPGHVLRGYWCQECRRKFLYGRTATTKKPRRKLLY